MKATKLITKLEASEGKVIALKSTGAVVGKVVFPAQSQSENDFIEVDEPEEPKIEE
jgi:hypothetical protein